jgi:hypothetical protein
MVLMSKISLKYYQHIMKSQKFESFLQKKCNDEENCADFSLINFS